jgi:hypothetical protein
VVVVHLPVLAMMNVNDYYVIYYAYTIIFYMATFPCTTRWSYSSQFTFCGPRYFLIVVGVHRYLSLYFVEYKDQFGDVV